MIKLCPIHGEINWPVASVVCPVRGCGQELDVYANEVAAALSLPIRERGEAPASSPGPQFPVSLFDEAPQVAKVRDGGLDSPVLRVRS
jgi:hypothetical protein